MSDLSVAVEDKGGVVESVNFDRVYEEGDLPQARGKYADAISTVAQAVTEGRLRAGVYVVIAEFPTSEGKNRSASIQASTMRKRFPGYAFRVIMESGTRKLLCAVEPHTNGD